MQTTKNVIREIAKNAAMGIPKVRNWRLQRPRAGARFQGSDEELRRYAFQSLDLLTATVGGVRGLRVAEIGPGDLLTSGLALLAAGASHYACLDRFAGDYDSAQGTQWYHGIERAWSRHYPELPWPSWLSAADFPGGYPDRVTTCDLPVEQAPDLGTFDLVCSFQVAEHVSDIEAFAEVNRRLLTDDGVAVHRVDFGPHDVWRTYPDPLTFLRFPDRVWRLMGSARGMPNRYRVDELRAAFERAGFQVSIHGRELIPAGTVEVSKLAPRFREMPLESLLTRTAIFVLRPA